MDNRSGAATDDHPRPAGQLNLGASSHRRDHRDQKHLSWGPKDVCESWGTSYQVRLRSSLVRAGVIDGLPSAWLDIWAAGDPTFEPLLTRARVAEAEYRRLQLPGQLRDGDVATVRALAGGSTVRAVDPRDLRRSVRRCLWARWWAFEDAAVARVERCDWSGLVAVVRSWLEELAFIETLVPAVHARVGGMAGLRRAAEVLDSRAKNVRGRDAVAGEPSWLFAAVEDMHGHVHPDYAQHLAMARPDRGAPVAVALECIASLSARLVAFGIFPASSECTDPVVADVEVGGQLADIDRLLRAGVPGDYSRGVAAVEGLQEALQAHRDLLEQQVAEGNVEREWDVLARVAMRFGSAAVGVWGALQKSLRCDATLGFGRALAVQRWYVLLDAADALAGEPVTAAASLSARINYLIALSDAAAVVLRHEFEVHVAALLHGLARGNPLLVALSARAVLEHHAASSAAIGAVREKTSLLRAAGGAAIAQSAALTEMERPLLRLLAGGGNSKTSETPLSIRAREVGATLPGRLTEVIVRAFLPDGPDGPVLRIWSTLSEIVHGNNGSLNLATREANAGLFLVGTAVLVELLKPAHTFRLVAEYHEVGQLLRGIDRALEGGGDLRREMRRQEVPPYLVPGRDFSGSGTQEDPYVLLRGNGVDEYEDLLRTVGAVPPYQRSTVVLPGAGITDEVLAHERTLYVTPVEDRMPPKGGTTH